jgi:uncharacterized membrane protein
MAGSGDLRRARIGGVVLGLGMGGFFDGILLHQILRWHNMLSTVLPPTTLEAMHTNMLWDGLFHAVVWVATLAGIFLIYTGAHRASVLPSAAWLIGLMLIGWGIFNFTEGLINHHILGIHHVREWGPNPAWDYGFLLSGPFLIGLGWLLTRSDNARSGVERRRRVRESSR